MINEAKESESSARETFASNIKVSHNLREHILQSKDKNIFIKFEHEYSATWKTDQLQLVKLFEIDLDGRDPFYIEGQDLVRVQKKE